jgi:hypothetical protein
LLVRHPKNKDDSGNNYGRTENSNPRYYDNLVFGAVSGGTSGMRIFFDFGGNVMGTSLKHLRCHREESSGIETIQAIEGLCAKTAI